jgi:hypothetical protein
MNSFPFNFREASLFPEQDSLTEKDLRAIIERRNLKPSDLDKLINNKYTLENTHPSGFYDDNNDF